MEENKRHIDDFLRDELGSYTETPPPAVWEDLEKRLDSPTNRKGFDFRKWWWFIPALLFVAGGSFLAAHKWNQKPTAPAAPTTIDTAVDNGIIPDNMYRDTAAKTIDTAAHQPTVKPVDTASHTQTNTSTKQPQTAQDKPHKTKTTAAATHKTGNQNQAITTPGTPATTGNNHAAVTNSSNHTNTAPLPADNKATTAKSKGKKHAATAGNDNHTTAAPTDNKATTAKRQKLASTTIDGDNAATGTNAVSDNTTTTTGSSTTTGTAKAGKHTRAKAGNSKQQTAATTTVASGSNTPGQDASGTNGAKTNTSSAPAANKAKKQRTTRPAPDEAKDNTPAITKTDLPVKNTAARPAKTAKQKTQVPPKDQAPAIAKNKPAHAAEAETRPQAKKQKQPKALPAPVAARNTTPAANKTPKAVTGEANATKTTRTAKPAKETPVAAARTNEQHTNTSNIPVQASPAKEGAKDQEYTFKSKTETKEAPKAKDNLDLSDKQAEAEADTTAEGKGREMDPYASLNPPEDKKKARLEGGIKAAYTYGFGDLALNKISVLPYVQLNINTKLSIALHLGFSYGQMNKTTLDGTKSYYSTTPSMQTSSIPDSSGGQFDTLYTYKYSQLRDSFSVKHSITKSLWEIELPVVFKYNLSSSLSIFAGPVFTFGKLVEINEDKSQTYSRTIQDSIVNSHNQYTIAYFNNLHKPSGEPAANYSNAGYQNATSTPMRIGYTAGVSYNASGRIVADLSIQQMLSSANFIPNETIRKVYTQPYVRLAIGFKLFK